MKDEFFDGGAESYEKVPDKWIKTKCGGHIRIPKLEKMSIQELLDYKKCRIMEESNIAIKKYEKSDEVLVIKQLIRKLRTL